MAYIGRQQDGFGVRSRFIYTATGGQTTFTTDDSNNALSYSDGAYVDVYLNGVLLDPADYTATSLTSIVLDSGATASDILEVIVYDVFSVFSGTFTNGITANTATVTGDLTVDTDTLFVDSTNDRVGIGTSSPTKDVHLKTTTTSNQMRIEASGGNLNLGNDSTGSFVETSGNRPFRNFVNGSERMRIDSSGDVLIGTTSAYGANVLNVNGGIAIDGRSASTPGLCEKSDINTGIFWPAADTLAVSTNGTERMRIRDDGNVGVGTAGASTVRFYVKDPSNSSYTGYFRNEGASYNGAVLISQTSRSSTSAFSLAQFYSSSDQEFNFRGDGNAFADGSFTGGGADYAEMFEWDDGNSSNEDRRGYSVVLTNGNKIRKATSDDAAADIIGVVSANPTVLGDSAWNMWDEKYNKDDFGNYILETYTVTEWTEPAVTNEDGEVTQEAVEHSYETDKIPSDLTVPSDAVVSSVDADGNTLERRQLNSNYDDTQTYTPREERQEWDAVGMMGKLRMRSGQPTGDRWIKMRDITSDIEEWLVR